MMAKNGSFCIIYYHSNIGGIYVSSTTKEMPFRRILTFIKVVCIVAMLLITSGISAFCESSSIEDLWEFVLVKSGEKKSPTK